MQIHFSLPWNQTTYLGYFGEIVQDIVVTAGYIVANGALLLLFISISIYHQAFQKIFKHSVVKLKAIGKKNKDEVICELVRLHVSAKQ